MTNKRGNPQEFLRSGNEPVAEQPISVKLPLSIDSFVRSLPNRTEWLREAITEKYQREQTQAN
ncbi:hypothetical protein [Chroococcidiopsis sp. CCMEE 29]|uniref:hypothetical protein n=1 Tax=Chroococcidiopsis sp. CCMEE 29 TaxID=155894 RepID=UPI00202008BF|nr:hypothetical protein [Chroococcidiopsis sp. CCMEE 29]